MIGMVFQFSWELFIKSLHDTEMITKAAGQGPKLLSLAELS